MTDDEILYNFLFAVCDGGTPVADCTCCGTTWFHPEGEYMEPDGEFERIQAKAAAAPEKYRPAEHSVSYGHALGYQFVFDCRCDKAKKIAVALWDNRHPILRFYGKVNEEEKASSKATEEALKGL